nr:pentatricopeptide repeat-containing protein At5g47360-like [Ipomoea trifida]
MNFLSISRHFSTCKKPNLGISNVLLFSTASSSSFAASQFMTHLQKNGPNIEKSLNLVKAELDAPCVTRVLESFSVENRQIGLRFFIWAGVHPSYRHSTYMYNKACNLLKVKENPNIVTDAFEAYEVEGCVVSVKMFRVVFNLCREAKDAGLGLWVLRKMKDFNCRPDMIAYNGVIRLLCEKGDIDGAMGLMREMGLIDLYPDMATYVMMIKGLSEVGRLEEACRLVKSMRGHGCLPGTVVYSVLLDGILRFGSLERAMELLEEMEKEGGDCRPNVVTYTTLIQGFVEKGCSVEARAILGRIEDLGCKPNRVLISTLIHGLCVDGHVEEAHKVVNRVAGNGVSNDECHSSLVLSLFRTGKLNEAEVVFRRMLAAGLKPDSLSSGTIIKWLCSEGRILDGYQLMDGIEKAGCISSMESDTYSILLDGLCRGNHLMEGAKLANLMIKKGIRVKSNYVKDIIKHLKSSGEEELASRIGRIQC